MLDMKQAEPLVAQLQTANRTDKTVDPALPLELARARRQTDERLRRARCSAVVQEDVSSFGLVGAGLSARGALAEDARGS